jgi:hypothetical protein
MATILLVLHTSRPEANSQSAKILKRSKTYDDESNQVCNPFSAPSACATLIFRLEWIDRLDFMLATAQWGISYHE